MRRRTVFLACAALGLGLSEHAAAQELPVPLPALEPDVATVVAAAQAAVEVELPTLDVPALATPTEVEAPSAEPAETAEAAETPVEAAPAEQYQPAEPQYQPPEQDGVAESQETTNAPAPAGPVEAEDAPTDGASSAATVGGAAAPQTWTWNWNWNCVDPPSTTTAPQGASNWSWNWNWNCDPDTNPAVDVEQYQPPTTQYQDGNTNIFQGGNTNIGIRIASPGDDGPVTQTTSTVTQVTTTIVTEVTQAIDDATESVLPAIQVPTVPVVRAPPPELVRPSTPFESLLDSLLDPVLPAIDVAPLPPLVIPVPGIAVVVAGGLDLVSTPAPRGSTTAKTAADRHARPQLIVGPLDGHAATAARAFVTPRPAAGARGRAGASTPLRKDRLPLWPPVPGGAGAGGSQSASAPGLALAAIAAALAAYLLVPPLGARPLRRARDRRRLGLVAVPLEPPG